MEASEEIRKRESICRVAARDMIDEIRCEEARKLMSASEQHTETVRVAKAEHYRMKQTLAEQRHEVEQLNANLFSDMQASQGAATKASQEVSARKASIAKHELAYSIVCGDLVVERAGRGTDADQADMMRRIHEEAACFRNGTLEAKADNEQLTYNLKEAIESCGGGVGRGGGAFPATQRTSLYRAAPKGPRVRQVNTKERANENKRRPAALKGPHEHQMLK